MQTTVLLDRDVEATLRVVARDRNVSLDVAINDTLRASLDGSAATAPPRFRMQTAPLGCRIDVDKALTIAGEMEDEEVLRKLERRM